MEPTSVSTEHAFSVYDLAMNRLSQGEDLFKAIQQMERVIVDNNVPWKKRSLTEPHRAFILGQTIDHESSNLEADLFNEEVKGGRENVYLLGIDFRTGHGKIIIHRLDSHFRAGFKSRLPRLDEMSPTEVAEWNSPENRRQFRDRIAELILFFSEDQMQKKINDQLTHCVGNFNLSGSTAAFVYALMLAKTFHNDSGEREKFVNNHKNLFGDTSIIRDALFFRAWILSDDEKHVHKMASYCQIRCLKSGSAL
jgi:hypothetical protein